MLKLLKTFIKAPSSRGLISRHCEARIARRGNPAIIKKTGVACIFFTLLSLSACTKLPPRHQLNACKIFQQYPTWYWDAQAAQRRWGVPISVQLAIIHQESHFRAHARPPHRHLLGFIPWFRPTTADGYAQAVESTWHLYLRSNHKRSASKANFADAVDFIGWYAHRAKREAGISPRDAYQVYLAYHEGILGYKERTYLRKPWLIKVAGNVRARAYRYRLQLARCRASLPKKPFWRFW